MMDHWPASLRAVRDLSQLGPCPYAGAGRRQAGDGVDTASTQGPAGPPVPRLRRPSYPVSPVVGPAGSRAAQEMIDAARRLFAERGYHGTSITAICAATQRSEAAFYQYFPSKHELFRMLYEEFGEALAGHFETLPPVTSGAAGRARLRRWLRGLGEVLGRHPTAFMEWPTPETGETAAENPQERSFVQYAEAMSASVGDAEVAGLSSRELTLGVLCLSAWSHVVLAARRSDSARAAADAAGLDDVVTEIVYGALFPRSPGSDADRVLLADPGAPRFDRAGAPVPAPTDGGQAGAYPGLRKSAATPAARAAVERITSAAAIAFDRHGLSGTSVNGIIAEAGVAHGTFYQYWTGRDAIFTTMAQQAATAVRHRFEALLRVRTTDDLAGWLDGWLDVIDRHGVILHILATQVADGLEPRSPDGDLWLYLDQVTGDLLGRAVPSHRPPGAWPPGASTIALWTIVTEFPYLAWRHRPLCTRDEIIRAQLFLLVRGLFG
jgi:AcrR family transcriptional regulator